MNRCYVVLTFINVVFSCSGSAANLPNSLTLSTSVFPPEAKSLFEWPSEAILNGPKRVLEKALPPEVAGNSLYWIKLTLDPAWQPIAPKIYALHDEFAAQDTVRMAWERKGRRIEASQTRNVFALKVISKEEEFGKSRQERIDAVRNLFSEVFTKTDTRSIPSPGPMTNFNARVASALTDSNAVINADSDDIVFGREGRPVRAPSGSKFLSIPVITENIWSDPLVAGMFWFRGISWWNNGHEVGFSFGRVNGGPSPFYVAEPWFREPTGLQRAAETNFFWNPLAPRLSTE